MVGLLACFSSRLATPKLCGPQGGIIDTESERGSCDCTVAIFMEFGNSSWVNPLTSEPGGFGGVPKDAIWGHPKPEGFGGTQNAGPQPGPGGMMGSTAPTPNGLNPYQQAATNAPDAKTGAGTESFNSAMPAGGPNQYQQFPPQYLGSPVVPFTLFLVLGSLVK